MNMSTLDGLVALVTGGARGIGFSYTKSMLVHGISKVYILDFNVNTGLESTASLIQSFGENRVKFIKVDVTNFAEFEAAVQQVLAESSEVNILINNAGVGLGTPEKIIAVNVMGVVNGITLALKYMGKDEGGQGGIVVNTASLAGLLPIPGAPIYTASKHAVVGLTRTYGDSFYYNQTGIKFIVICPGLTRTSLLDDLWKPDSADRTTDEDNFLRACRGMASQHPDEVGKCLTKVLQDGKPGSVWISNENVNYEIELPDLDTFKKL